VDAVIFFNDNMPLAEWWANVSAGIVFGGQGTHTIKVRNGDMYEADSLITFEKDSPIHFKVDLFVDVADNANNVYSVTATKEGGDPIVIASDYAFRNPAANIAYYLVKDFNAPQVLEEVIFENFEVELSTGMKPTISGKSNMDLKQNFPNPFSEITTISYTLKEDGLVRLSVYSESGSLVASLVNGKMVAGDHQIDFNASGFESGVYFYKIETQKFVGVKQMILIK
ncbi:MAG: T9SS type A sorting domain-containing protein, partial [Bacteroides sp.]|nr:T9SS type A sorting domain-containing protein [Bacteroides sp.]